jgi:N-formylmaleamate deformylase
MPLPFLTRRQGLILLAGAAVALPGIVRAAPPQPFESRRISVRPQGAGPDVILIPGLGSGPGIWNGVMRDVSGYRWHAVHVRGFAGLPAQDNALGALLSPLADEIARYARDNALIRPAIVGHSMGGLLGLLIALRHPQVAGRLMVVDMLPSGAAMVGGTAAGVGFLARQLRGYFTATPAGREAFASILRDAAPGGADSDPDVIAAALDELAGTDLGPRLPSIRTPLTIVPATPADPELAATALARTRSAYRGVAGARIVPVGPSGHAVMLDQPAKFAEAVRQFLGRG